MTLDSPKTMPVDWNTTCDSAEDGHGTDHGSLEAARHCAWVASGSPETSPAVLALKSLLSEFRAGDAGTAAIAAVGEAIRRVERAEAK